VPIHRGTSIDNLLGLELQLEDYIEATPVLIPKRKKIKTSNNKSKFNPTVINM